MCCLGLITVPLMASFLLVGTIKKFLVFHHRAMKRSMFKRLIVFHLLFSAFIFDSLRLLYDALICAYFEARQFCSRTVSATQYSCTVYAGNKFWEFVPFYSPVSWPANSHPSAHSPHYMTATNPVVYKARDKQQTWLNSEKIPFNALTLMTTIIKGTLKWLCFVLYWYWLWTDDTCFEF